MTPYAALGLRGNPFSYDFEDELEPIDRGFRICPAPDSGAMIQLIGRRGAGKTTQIASWRKTLAGPHVYVEEGSRPHLPVGSISYWDEADRITLPRLVTALARVSSSGGTVVVGTHKSLAIPARILGLRVHTFVLGGPSVEQVDEWARRAIESASVSRSPLSDVPSAEIVDRCGGSWRRAGHLLHAWAAAEAGVAVRNPVRVGSVRHLAGSSEPA